MIIVLLGMFLLFNQVHYAIIDCVYYSICSGQLLKCSGCQYVYYCGKVCQKEAWSLHKKECPLLKRISPRIIPDAARFLSRIVLKLKNGGDQIKSFYTEDKFRMFKDLMSRKMINNDLPCLIAYTF